MILLVKLMVSKELEGGLGNLLLHHDLLCSQAHLSQTKSPFPSSIISLSSGNTSLPHNSHFIDCVFVTAFALVSLCYKHHFPRCPSSPSFYSLSSHMLQTRQPTRHSRRYLHHWNLKHHYYCCFSQLRLLLLLIACWIISDFAL
jgi:hypothetical protein